MWWAKINLNSFFVCFFLLFTFSFHSLSRGVVIFVVLLISCDVSICWVLIELVCDRETMFRHKEIMTFKWYCFLFYGYVCMYMFVCMWYFVSRLYRILIGLWIVVVVCFFSSFVCCVLGFVSTGFFSLCLSFGIHALCIFFRFSSSHSLLSFIFHPFFRNEFSMFISWI